MKILNVKINSSVISFNLLALVAMLIGTLGAWVTDNQQLINEVLTPTQAMVAVGVVNMVNLYLRTSNVQGKKPIELVDKSRH